MEGMDPTRRPFDSLYAHGFARVAACVPTMRVSDPAGNSEATIALAREADAQHAVLAVFPELGLSGYTSDDLFHQDALLDEVERGIAAIVDASASLTPILLVGAPLRHESKLFNVAIAVHRGRVLAVTPKSYLPNYREFYEKRWFAAARDAVTTTVRVAGQDAPFGTNILIEATDLPGFVVHAEICEDVWTPAPPSTWAALGGATVLANLSASNITVGKAGYRHQLCRNQSARCIAAYMYVGAGEGESTTDLAWDGHALVYENGNLLAESERFAADARLVCADIDLERLRQDRMRMTSFADNALDHAGRVSSMRRVPVELGVPTDAVPLRRDVPRFPYVPSDSFERNERCAEVYHIQVQGLATRLASTGIDKLVIGVSGGLDSTQALIVSARAMDHLGLPRTNVLAYTMPGFATSRRTLTNAHALMQALGVTASEIDIRPSSTQMLADLGHPAATGEAVYDRTFENVQAGERTSHLFRLANHHNGLVVGTGDLSELALGWATFGVGDHMAHYNVNGSVPKTLIQYLIRWVADSGEVAPGAREVLLSIVDTEISPELIPSADGGGEAPGQRSEDTVGPYELQDFHLYHLTRYGFRPSRIAYLAHHAWGDRTRGTYPDLLPGDEHNEYDLATIVHWLRVFLTRFHTNQFKRSTLPNGPKVGSGGSLSPRGDWRQPSDSTPAAWLDELDRNVPR
jgi:NAD+ synthase (glutamine-hydrolysing)